jgi:release factor glutamine methyltransferase
MPVYEPQEDSIFLVKIVMQRARGEVLDVGTGTGIQAFAAAERAEVTSVIAVDIDPEAVAYAQDALQHQPPAIRQKVRIIVSDLFAAVPTGMLFETIICNPPYLPEESTQLDPTIYGGPHGWELIARFLHEAKAFLKPGGELLLLFSSITDKGRVTGLMKQEGYAFEELGADHQFFEDLFVYKLTIPA